MSEIKSQTFDATPEGYHDLPITRPILDATGQPEGEDSGYRKKPVDESDEPLVDLQEVCRDLAVRANYDGKDEIDGSQKPELILPGGTDGKVFARESVSIALDVANRYLADRYGSNVQTVVFDALRRGLRQAAGFTRKAIEQLGGATAPDMKALYAAGMTADGTFSWVNPDFDSPEYREFADALRNDPFNRFLLEEIAAETGKPFDDVLENFAIICANLYAVKGEFPNAPSLPLNKEIPLNFQNNAHAGGGAVDMMLMVDGKPASSPVPFDWVGEEAAIEYMEDDANLERFRQKVAGNAALQKHVQRLGVDPANITEQQWAFWRDSNRILHHVMKGVGATYYSAADPKHGGENWHKEPGNLVWTPDTERKLVHRGGFANTYPDSGNPGHALQRGAKAAVWGGKGAHEQLGYSN